jgi:hypothetical protein
VSGFVGHGRGEVTDLDELISVEEHLEALLALLPNPDPIELRLADALGLVLADPVASEVTVPAFANSAMDGYAVIARDTRTATVDKPVRLAVDGEVAAGVQELPTVRPGRSVRIMTGAPMPPGADAVVPVEVTSKLGVDVGIHRAVERGANIREPGEDLQPGQQLLARGRRLGTGRPRGAGRGRGVPGALHPAPTGCRHLLRRRAGPRRPGPAARPGPRRQRTDAGGDGQGRRRGALQRRHRA